MIGNRRDINKDRWKPRAAYGEDDMVNVGSIDILIHAFSDVEDAVNRTMSQLVKLENWQKGLMSIGQQRRTEEMAVQKVIQESTAQSLEYLTSLEGVNVSAGNMITIIREMTKQFNTQIPVIKQTTDNMGGLLGMTMRQTMGFLGLMFFTQRLAQALGFLNQKIYENFLAGEMMNLQWELFAAIIPVIQPFLDMFYQLLGLFYELPESAKTFVGMVIVLGGLFASIASNVLQFVVMLGALSALGAGGAFAGIIGFLAPILPIIAAIALAVAALYLAWKTNFLGMQETVKKIFEGLGIFFKGLGLIWKGIMEGNAKLVMAGVGKIAIGAVEIIVNAIGWLLKLATRTMLSFIWLPGQIAGFIGDAFDIKPLQKFAELANKPFEILDNAIDSGLSTVNEWLDDLDGMIDEYASLDSSTSKATDSVTGFTDSIDTATTSMAGLKDTMDLDSSYNSMESGFSSTIDNMINDTERFKSSFQSNVIDMTQKSGTYTTTTSTTSKSMVSTAPKATSDWLDYFKAFGKSTGGQLMWDWYKSGSLSESIYKEISKDAFWFKNGGIVPGQIGQPVPAIVHGGETIIPAGKGMGTINFSPTVNISATVKEEADIKRISSMLMDDWKRELRRMV